MSENDMIMAAGSGRLFDLLRCAVKEALVRHDEERLKGISPDCLFTRREVSEMFNLEYSSIRRMIERGSLRTTLDGRYIPKKEIDRYLSKRNCLSSAGEQLRPMPDPIASLHDESCHPGGGEAETQNQPSPLLRPGSFHAKGRSEGIEKNPKAIISNNLKETK